MFRYFNPNELSRLLGKGQVPIQAQMAVLTVLVVFQHLFGRFGLIDSFAYRGMIPFALFPLGMVIVSLWIGYLANGGSQGKDFLTRYFILGGVIFLWTYLGAYLIYTLVYWFARYTGRTSFVFAFRPYGPATLVFMVVSSFACLLAIQYYLYRLAHNDAA